MSSPDFIAPALELDAEKLGQNLWKFSSWSRLLEIASLTWNIHYRKFGPFAKKMSLGLNFQWRELTVLLFSSSHILAAGEDTSLSLFLGYFLDNLLGFSFSLLPMKTLNLAAQSIYRSLSGCPHSFHYSLSLSSLSLSLTHSLSLSLFLKTSLRGGKNNILKE